MAFNEHGDGFGATPLPQASPEVLLLKIGTFGAHGIRPAGSATVPTWIFPELGTVDPFGSTSVNPVGMRLSCAPCVPM